MRCILVNYDISYFSMSIGDHMHSEKVYFYQIGLGSSNSVNEDGWKLATLKSIRKKLKHTEVSILNGMKEKLHLSLYI